MIDFYFSFTDPYSYLAAPRALSIDRRFDIDLRLCPVEINGIGSLRDPKSVYLLGDCRREARRLRLSFGPLCIPTPRGNRDALLVVLGAMRQGGKTERTARELVLRISRAVWTEAADLANRSVLYRLAAEVGLREAEVREWVSDPRLGDQLRENLRNLRAEGHWSVPTLVYDHQPFWGQDRIDVLESTLAHAGLTGSQFQLDEAASRSFRPLASRFG